MEFQGIEVIDGNRQQQQKRYTTGATNQYILAIELDYSNEPDISFVFGLGAHLSIDMDLTSPSSLDKAAAKLIILARNLANNTRWLLCHWNDLLAWQQPS